MKDIDYEKDSAGFWIEKDPDAELDYSMDWKEWLNPVENIIESVWIMPAELSASSSAHTQVLTSVWISGGILNKTYLVSNRIRTDQNRKEDRSFRIKMKQR